MFGVPTKRSVTIAGHETSISLEPVFWAALVRAADTTGLPLNALIAQIDVERIAVPRDQLHPEREPSLADQLPHPVEPLVIAGPGHSLGQSAGHRRGVGWCGEARFVDQPVEQSRPPRQLIGQRRGVVGAQRIVHDHQMPYGHMPIEDDLKACGPANQDGEIRAR